MKIALIFVSAQAESKSQEKLLELAVNWDCLDGAQNAFKYEKVL